MQIITQLEGFRTTSGLITLCIFYLFAAPAQAVTVTPESVNQTLSSATLVAEIEVERTKVKRHPEWFARYESEARVLKVLTAHPDEGWIPNEGDSLTIAGPGGEIEGIGVMFSGSPRPYVHRKYRAYLQRIEDRQFRIVGMEKGLVRLDATRDYSRNRTDGSNGDGMGAYLYWDDSYFPIPYFISSTTFAGHPDFVSAVDESFRTWRAPQDLKVDFIPMGCTTNRTNDNDGINTVILVTTAWPFDPAAIAITRNFYIAGQGARSGQILDSDIMLNSVNHHFTVTDENGKHDVQNIVTHEVGHFLGLGHEVTPMDPDATMYAIASPNEYKKRTLHADDLLGIHAAYSGVGNKISLLAEPSCLVSDKAVPSCNAIHRNDSHDVPWGFFLVAGLWLVGSIVAGRNLALLKTGNLLSLRARKGRSNLVE